MSTYLSISMEGGVETEISMILPENRRSPGASSVPQVGPWALSCTPGVLVSQKQAMCKQEQVHWGLQRAIWEAL